MRSKIRERERENPIQLSPRIQVANYLSTPKAVADAFTPSLMLSSILLSHFLVFLEDEG